MRGKTFEIQAVNALKKLYLFFLLLFFRLSCVLADLSIAFLIFSLLFNNFFVLPNFIRIFAIKSQWKAALHIFIKHSVFYIQRYEGRSLFSSFMIRSLEDHSACSKFVFKNHIFIRPSFELDPAQPGRSVYYSHIIICRNREMLTHP